LCATRENVTYLVSLDNSQPLLVDKNFCRKGKDIEKNNYSSYFIKGHTVCSIKRNNAELLAEDLLLELS
jgi:hypothetical protein